MNGGLIERDELQALLQHRKRWCVSLFLPTHRHGTETRQGPILLKNLLRDATAQLVELGMRETEARELLAPASERVEDHEFWQHQQEGLAIYLAPDLHRELRLGIDLEAMATVADLFEVKPLLPLLLADGHYYVLALSQARARLLLCTRDTVAELDVPGMPSSMEEALQHDDPEQQLQWHTRTAGPGAPGERQAMFFGQGGGDNEQEKVDLWRYFLRIDRALHPFLAEERAPMVIASVEYLRPIYREANTYRSLLEEGIDGNPDQIDARTLRDRAWDIVQPHFLARIDQARERFGNLSDTDRIAVGVDQALPAAYDGRVDTLFVQRDAHLWGRFDIENNRLEMHGKDTRQPGDVDLLDLAARGTVLNGGVVYALDASQMPGSKPVAAVLRY